MKKGYKICPKCEGNKLVVNQKRKFEQVCDVCGGDGEVKITETTGSVKTPEPKQPSEAEIEKALKLLQEKRGLR